MFDVIVVSIVFTFISIFIVVHFVNRTSSILHDFYLKFDTDNKQIIKIIEDVKIELKSLNEKLEKSPDREISKIRRMNNDIQEIGLRLLRIEDQSKQ